MKIKTLAKPYVIFFFVLVIGIVSNIFFDLPKGISTTKINSQLAIQMEACEIYEYSDSNFLASERRTCYNDKIFSHIRENGLKSTLLGLEDYMKTEQGSYLVGTRCHDIGHGIGIEAVKAGYSSREILETCSTSCEGGCLNGAGHVFITTLSRNGDLNSFCDLDGINKTVRDMCFHGIGHGLMEYYSLDIPKVIKDCQRIEKNSDKFQCGHAAFMDTNLVNQAPFDKIPKKLYEYCKELEEVLRYSCYQFGGFLTFVRDLDINESFDFCTKVPTQISNICFSRIGESAYLRNNGDAQKTLGLCKRVENNQFRSCLKGANIFSIHTPDSSFGTKAKNICLAVEGEVRSGCLSDLGAMIVKTYGNEQLNTFCETLTSIDKKNCFEINQSIINEPDFVQAD